MKHFLGGDVLLAGIESAFYFGSKEIYEKVLSKRDLFYELGYEMKAPEGAKNEKDFKTSNLNEKNESNNSGFKSFKVTFE